jgi:hypothetical protein
MACGNLNSSTPTRKEDELPRITTCHTNKTNTKTLNLQASSTATALIQTRTRYKCEFEISCSPNFLNPRPKTIRTQNPSLKNKPPQLQLFQKNATKRSHGRGATDRGKRVRVKAYNFIHFA